MSFTITHHAASELQRRRIPSHVLDPVLERPEQIVAAHGGLLAYQSRVEVRGRTFLLRAIVDESAAPKRVVTVYLTSKIAKYWSPR